MALNDRKITVYANPVANLPDHPSQTGFTAAQLKAAFDAIANEEVKVSINGIIDDVIATADGVSGADQIGATAIIDLDGATVQSVLESLRNKLKSIIDSSSGADFIGATAISNLDGTTVQAILESLRNKIKSTVDGSSGADFIGATALKVGGATTVQGQLEEIQALETPREEAEVIRVSQEAVRVLTENSRVIAESSRANAETSRTNAESGRVTAENNRVTAEQTRVEADILRGQTVAAIEENYAPRLTTAEEQINNFVVQEDWITPTLLNGWVNYGLAFSTAGYYKDKFERVYIKGMIKSGTTTFGTIIFTLPIGYRPTELLPKLLMANTSGPRTIAQVNINPDGTITIEVTGNTWLNLDISFKAEQ